MMIQAHIVNAIARRQKGFALITAIFLLVVMAGLGGAIVSISTSQHAGSALDIQGTRAYHAARSGVEWGVYKVVNNSACFAASSFVPQAPTLSGFTVTVTCFSSPGPGITVYQIQSTACNQPSGAGICPGPGGSATYVERQIQVTL